MEERINTVLDFWFGPLETRDQVDPERVKFWFQGDPETDATIRETFQSDVELAAKNGLDHWPQTPRGRLALIILLDQFTRNIYRGTGHAFFLDHNARTFLREGLVRGHDKELTHIERVFFYLPFEHSENLVEQIRSVSLYQALVDEAPEDQRSHYENFLDYAVRHKDVIARFGRFPHRNERLGRASTPEEIEFLKQPGSSFG